MISHLQKIKLRKVELERETVYHYLQQISQLKMTNQKFINLKIKLKIIDSYNKINQNNKVKVEVFQKKTRREMLTLN